jgi:hypothetical protein
MATDPSPEPEARAADGPPTMTPYAIAVALFAAFVVGGILGRAVPLGWSFLLAWWSGPSCPSSSTATRACPGVDGHAESDILASARTQ